MRFGSLFSGYNGLDLGVQSVLGGTTAWFCEFDKAPSKILAHHWPDVPNLGDITQVDWATVEPVDALTGGSPCQDLSHAGKRAGMTEGTRSNLWVQMREAIDALRPRLVVWENVRGALSAPADSDLEPCPGCVGGPDDGPVLRALGRVLGDLSELGYDTWWTSLRAADVGAAHGRFRVFLFAWPADAESDTRRLLHGDGRATPDADGWGREGGAQLDGDPAQAAADWDSPRQHPDGHPRPEGVTVEQTRITERVEVDPESGCWMWTGWTNKAAIPYGRVSIKGRKVYAHRASHEAFIGPIPEGYEIDHLCQTSLCVNPEHLEAVTREENRARVAKRRTHCIRGHEFTEENTYWVRLGARACRQCRAWQDLVQKARRKGEDITLLPTPACNDMGAAYTPEEWDAWTDRMKAAHGNGNGHGKSLSIEAQRLLPTPRTSDTNGAGAHGSGGPDLRTVVDTLLPTPSVADATGGHATRSGARSDELLLPGVARAHAEDRLLPTPMVGSTSPAAHGQISGDYRARMADALASWGDYAPAIARWEAAMGRPAPEPTEPGKNGNPRLSPAFVEFLMGLPAGHVTDPAIGLTRNEQLKCLGNGVVWQQCAAATRAFIHDITQEAAA